MRNLVTKHSSTTRVQYNSAVQLMEKDMKLDGGRVRLVSIVNIARPSTMETVTNERKKKCP